MESSQPVDTSASRDELRTIGFRLREIQHLLAVRVAQENRRLEQAGIEPVEDPPFADRQPKRARPPGQGEVAED